ncbi:hypothetical protein A2671_00680 [Candidatus Kaiserbacteria bacterium RIFCSPHIGHO2_01_FULL_49_13]|uniref:Uncharacterized protein n=1 Tax=Candidatus Kaiserbacteria bacterium RIFCSPHIGHO2_01_FULL_49_13 TaxID=1798477 RepID=A0A1F6CEZ1_9BACT|nr:MAG: hypothetical protein A2671_00680 [Candidatus Kaiserbacteria bacterium RIFCSPHIGHO2_01_FULL_49_13]
MATNETVEMGEGQTGRFGWILPGTRLQGMAFVVGSCTGSAAAGFGASTTSGVLLSYGIYALLCFIAELIVKKS